MKINRVFQVNTELFKITGIQKVLLDIHEALKDDFNVRIVGTIPFSKVNENLEISKNDYIRLKNPFMFRKSVVIIHERKLLPFMWILTNIPGLNIKCIYVHHNELYGNKWLSLFPKNIVAISDAGIRNLTEYFGIPRDRITKIHNCVRESFQYLPRKKKFDPDNITILYPARINSVKRQIEIVNFLRGKIDSRIKILFAGLGPRYNELDEICNGDKQFQVLGFRNDIHNLMQQCDFMLLFSKHEGLPISLIEACQVGLPVICNNVGGNTEIVKNGVNGFVVDNWEELANVLNKLPKLSENDIEKMSETGKNIYMDKFNFDNFKDNYRILLERIV